MLCASVSLALMFLVLTNDAPVFFIYFFSVFLYWKVDYSNHILENHHLLNLPFQRFQIENVSIVYKGKNYHSISKMKKIYLHTFCD